MGETGSDDISCQIAKSGFFIRFNPVTNIKDRKFYKPAWPERGSYPAFVEIP
jgi:hypothetical protein